MLDMTNAPIPMAMPAMAPGLIMVLLRLELVRGGAEVEFVSFDEAEVVSPRGTFNTDASDNA